MPSRIAQETERLLAAMRRHRDGWLGQVRIGSSTTALIYHLPPVLQDLRTRHPNIELVVTTGTTSGVVERILQERDRSRRREPADQRAPVGGRAAQERAAGGHLLGPVSATLPARVTPQFLLQHPLLLEYARAHVRALIMDWLSAGGQEPRPAMELDNLEAVKRMVASGLGASIVPAAAIADAHEKSSLAARPLKPALTRTLALVQRRDKPGDAALQHVREALMALAED